MSSPVNQPSPRVYGFASGDPLTLSMLSSRRGARVGYVGALGGNMVGLKVELEGGRVRWLVVAFGLVGDAARTGANEGGLLSLCGPGEGFGTGGRVVGRRAPGVRLTANARDAFEGPPTVFFGVAVIMRAVWCGLGQYG